MDLKVDRRSIWSSLKPGPAHWP